MSLTSLIQQLKGGSGSGNHGHSGIPGHVGGSAPNFGGNVKVVSSVSELIPLSNGIGYYVLPDGRLVDANMSGGDHEDAAKRMANYVDNYKPNAQEMRVEDPYMSKVISEGVIRVREFGDHTAIETAKIDTAELRKVKNLVDEGKIRLQPGQEHVWSADNYGDSQYIYFHYDELMSSKYVTNGKLKEY